MSITGINGSSGNQGYQLSVQKIGGQSAQQVQPNKAQGTKEETQENAVEKSIESPQENQGKGTSSINFYA